MAHTDDIIVRAARPADAPQLLQLMRALAQFEGYIDQFKVSESDLLRAGFGSKPPAFQAFVASNRDGSSLCGMAVTYTISWTYDLAPTLVLKELFVPERFRAAGVGRALMQAVAQFASKIGAPRLQWTVLPQNQSAKRFYADLGARPDTDWDPWIMDSGDLARFASMSDVICPPIDVAPDSAKLEITLKRS